MVSIVVPISYLVFLFGSLAVFSRYYRAKQNKKEAAPPWFPKHKSRDIYVSLLSLDPPPPQPILIAALLRRAMDDVRLIWQIRDSKQALTTLLGRGQIGDDLWERFQTAEKELEAEIVEVVGEANTFQEGYGQQIFGIASEMVSHERWKEIYEKIAEQRVAEQARMDSPLPTLALSPNIHLSPSSLTLSPSNPLPSFEAAAAIAAAAPPATTPVALGPVAPLEPATSTPPPVSPPATPAKPSAPSTPAAKPSTPAAAAPSIDFDEDDVAPASGTVSPSRSSAAGTPGVTPNGKKRVPKKKKVKGGR